MENFNYAIGFAEVDVFTLELAMKAPEFASVLEIFKIFFFVSVTIMDNREEFAKMGKFLEENNLEDENPFFNYFDIDSYGMMLDFISPASQTKNDYIEVLLYIFSQQLSKKLQTRCMLFFENLRIPIALFENGFVIETFDNYNNIFFKHRGWSPRKI